MDCMDFPDSSSTYNLSLDEHFLHSTSFSIISFLYRFSHFYSTIFDAAQLNAALNARCLPGLSLSLGRRHSGVASVRKFTLSRISRQRASTSLVHKIYGAYSCRFAESKARITRQNNSKPLYQQHPQVLIVSASVTAKNSQLTSTFVLLESQMQSIAVVYCSIWHSHFDFTISRH